MTEEQDESSYFIESDGFIANHHVHRHWALGALSKKHSIRENANSLCVPRELYRLRGKGCDLSKQKEFFQKKLSKLGIEKILLKYLPTMIDGLAGAALQPLIHIAIGILYRNNLMVAEGLAYLNHSYLSSVTEEDTVAAHCSNCKIEQPQEVSETTKTLHCKSTESSSAPPPPTQPAVDTNFLKTPSSLLVTERFQRAMVALLSDTNSVDVLNEEPANLPLDAKSDTHSYTSMDFLFFHALRLYVGTGSNDYFLLHATCCAFALQVIFEAVSFPLKVKIDASNAFKIAFVATDWIQGCQSVPRRQCWRKQWQQLTCKNEETQVKDFSIISATKWIEERSHFLLNEDALVPRNEHVYKCVAICKIVFNSMVHKIRLLSREPMEIESQRIVDLCAAVDLCMSCNFSGCGIVENPTTSVDNITSENYHMNQLVPEEVEKRKDNNETRPTLITSDFLATEPPKNPKKCAGIFSDKPGTCPLKPGTLSAQYDSITLKKDDGKLLEDCKLYPQLNQLFNARSCSAHDISILESLRSQLIHLFKFKMNKYEEDEFEINTEVKENNTEKENRKKFWNKIDVIVPILICLFTFIPSLALFIGTKSYRQPMFSLWVVISISSGEALGAMFEVIRFHLKPKTFLRSDRIMNYMFSSIIALVYGVILRVESIYWTRFWIVAILPMSGAFFKFSKDSKWSDDWSNFFATVMMVILVYRITLIGAVWEFSEYDWGLLLLTLPLVYVEMIWVSALCPFWLAFQSSFKDNSRATVTNVVRKLRQKEERVIETA